MKIINSISKFYNILKKADADEETTKALVSLLHDVAEEKGMGEYSYIVGGAVRDFVMGIFPKDIDVVVETKEDKNAITLGKAVAAKVGVPKIQADNYGVVHIGPISKDFYYNGVNLKGQKIEIVTARKEKYDKGSHKPSLVEPGTIIDDLKRRDFTFNTLTWKLSDLNNGISNAPILDMLGSGLEDLNKGVIRTPLDPIETFTDDPSRMLRAVRFAVKYDATLDEQTKQAIKSHAEEIKRMPWEPIGDVFVGKILKKLPKEKVKKAFELMNELNLLKPTLEYIDKTFLTRQIKSIYGNDSNMLMYINSWLDKFGIKPIIFKIPLEFYPKLVELYNKTSESEFQNIFNKLQTNIIDPKILMNEGIKGAELGQKLLEAKKIFLDNPNLSEKEILNLLI
jgi:tRNA nucleotidyltransferase/poly(A) polymerase